MSAGHLLDRLIDDAAALRAAGRVPEAIAAYERLLALAPDLANSWYNLALLQRQARLFDAALASYQRALDCKVPEPEEVHLNRGVIFADHLRREDDAERELHAALRWNPNYVPALFNLANLHEDRGLRDEARALYQRILGIEPNARDALARLAGVSKVANADDPLVQRLRQAMSARGCSAPERAHLGFALGRLLDGCGAYDDAFAAYVQANRDSQASAGPASPGYDRADHARFIDELIAAFEGAATNSARAEAAAEAGSRTPPIFICGMFRSGSTLVEQVLASHPRVTPGGELDLLPALAQGALAPFPAFMAQTDADRLRTFAENYLNQLAQLFPSAERLTDKRPDNYLYIGLIKTLFPGARIVHTHRNPLDNCLSLYFLHLDHGMAYALDLLDAAWHYKQYRRLMSHWKTLYGDDILDFDYDALVRSPKDAMASLLDFCGLEWNDNCLHFEKLRNAVKTASVWQVRQPLYGHASGRWKNYSRHLQALEKELRDGA